MAERLVKYKKKTTKKTWRIPCTFRTSYCHRLIGLVGRVFANGLGDLCSIPGRVISKALNMVLATSLLNTQQYKVRIKGKVEDSRERSCALLLHLGVESIKKGAVCSLSTTVFNFYNSSILRSENQPLFDIILVWSGSIWIVALTPANFAQISFNLFLNPFDWVFLCRYLWNPFLLSSQDHLFRWCLGVKLSLQFLFLCLWNYSSNWKGNLLVVLNYDH